MALETDTVDGGTGVLDDLDDLDSTVGLGAVVLEVVVVVVPCGVLVTSHHVVYVKGMSYSLALGSASWAALKDTARKSVPMVS